MKSTTKSVNDGSKRQVILAGIVSAAVFCIAWVYAGLAIWPAAVLANDTALDRLSYVLMSEIFVGLMLLLELAPLHVSGFSRIRVETVLCLRLARRWI